MKDIFTRETAIAIQEGDLKRWDVVLKPEVAKRLREIVISRNAILEKPDDICRGDRITMLVLNWPPCDTIINVALHDF